MASTTCPLCGQRKGKRACPAKGVEICSACCGAKRRVEIDCPDTCVYLGGAHAGSWAGRETERRRDALRVAPFVQGLTDRQAQLFFLTLAGLTGLRAARPQMDDRLLATAVAAFKKTLETRDHGILYEHSPDDQRAQSLVVDLKALYETKDDEGRPLRPDDRDLLKVMTALDAALAATLADAGGGAAFLDAAGRLVGRRSPPRPGARLIVGP